MRIILKYFICTIITIKYYNYYNNNIRMTARFTSLLKYQSRFSAAGSAPGAPKPVESCRRRIRRARVDSAHADQTSPDRRTCRKSVYRILRPCPPIPPNTTRATTVTTTQTKIPVTNSLSVRPRNPNRKPPIPGATSRVSIRTWTMSVSVILFVLLYARI